MSEPGYDKHRNPGYELSDARFKPIFISGVLFFALMVIGLVVVIGVAGLFESKREGRVSEQLPPLAEERPLPPGARLQVKPGLDYKQFAAKQDSILINYGWVQREAGLVRVPIDKAMEMALQRGFPVRSDTSLSTGARRN